VKYVNQTFRSLFNRSGLTVYRFAERAGMDEKYVRNLMNGKRSNPSIVTVLKLHNTLASNPAQLAKYPELAEASDLLLKAMLRDAATDTRCDAQTSRPGVQSV